MYLYSNVINYIQGTADIILDSCVDYWNGRDLTPISPSDRKKIIDFYQRNSLTAYCTAFAYKYEYIFITSKSILCLSLYKCFIEFKMKTNTI